MTPFQALLLLPFLLLISSSFTAQLPLRLSPGDLQSLANIRWSLHDLPGSTFFTTWNFSTDPCSSFSGILCSSSPEHNAQFLRVSVLTLGTGLSDSPGLGGTLPPSISDLTALTELVVFPGRVSGPIPADLGRRLPLLRLLSFSSNRLLGPIPPSLSNLPNLHTLDLSQNQLQGPLPPSLFSSNPNLKVLLLGSNGGLCGAIPPELSAATALLHLDLRSNSFTGTLPPLPASLRFLSAALNSLSGHLSLTLDLPDLEFLDLSENAFSGEVPPAIFSLPRLSTIILSHNNLSGRLSLVPSAGQQPRWAVVDISHNSFSGEPPAELAAAGNLYLNDNKFTGAVPTEYINCLYNGSTNTLYAQNNFLTVYSPPPAIAGMAVPSSASLCLSYNCMVPPPSSTAGCPSDARTMLSRPADQCAAAAVAGNG